MLWMVEMSSVCSLRYAFSALASFCYVGTKKVSTGCGVANNAGNLLPGKFVSKKFDLRRRFFRGPTL
jgi:hypothetical protein